MFHPPYSIFISYPDEDKYFKDTVSNFVSYMDIQCFVAEHQKSAGEELWDKISVMINSSTRVLLLYTRYAPNSEWMNREIAIARTFKKRFIPVKENGVALPAAVKGEDREHIPFRRDDFAYTLQRICQQIYIYRDRTPHVFRFVKEEGEQELGRRLFVIPIAQRAYWSNAYVDRLVEKGTVQMTTLAFYGRIGNAREAIQNWAKMQGLMFVNREPKPSELGL